MCLCVGLSEVIFDIKVPEINVVVPKGCSYKMNTYEYQSRFNDFVEEKIYVAILSIKLLK
jgi:hypothetical protein